MAKRQTIWLSTMMVLSLMLIGFYTVNNNTQAVLNNDNTKIASDQKTATGSSQSDKTVMQQSDYFTAQHLDEQKQLGAQIEQLQNVIANPKATADQVSQAQQQLDTLNSNQQKIGNLHDQLTATGFPDALVNMDINSNKVDVTVEAQTLDKKAAVQIMDMVQKQFPTAIVSVGYHA